MERQEYPAMLVGRTKHNDHINSCWRKHANSWDSPSSSRSRLSIFLTVEWSKLEGSIRPLQIGYRWAHLAMRAVPWLTAAKGAETDRSTVFGGPAEACPDAAGRLRYWVGAQRSNSERRN